MTIETTLRPAVEGREHPQGTSLLSNPDKQLSVDLKESTLKAHERAESSTFVSRLLEGELSREAFADLTAQLWFIYSALEAAVRAAGENDAIERIYDPALERQAALERDLEQLYGAEWESKIEVLDATARYAERLNELRGLEVAPLLVAHHYVRYLGDIAGGQVIARVVAGKYGVESEALNFYDFSELGKIKPYRDRYKLRLDSVVLTEEGREAVIEEAVKAFGFNFEVFSALSGRHE